MWLVWLATKMAGGSTRRSSSTPRTSGAASRCASGRVTLSITTARARRTG